MRKHLRLINNFQSDQKITISRVISNRFYILFLLSWVSNVNQCGMLCKQPLDICPKKASKHLYTCDKGDSVPFSDVKPPFSLSAPSPANMWPLSGIFLPSHCLSFWNRGSEICRPRILYEPSPRERFFGVLQSSFCFSQILCYEADKSQILVRNPQESRVHNLHSLYSCTRNKFTSEKSMIYHICWKCW